jgi:hypothetical protein
MNIKHLCLLGMGLLAICAAPAVAQQNLGDLVSEYGYEWLMGKWTTTTDEGDRVELDYKWGLDRNVVLVDFKMGDFKYHGMILFVPARQEVVQMGADNQGGLWNGTWSDNYNGAAHSMENLKADGTRDKSEMVHSKVDKDTMKIAVYSVDSYGYRGSTRGVLNLKRQIKK